MPRHILKSKLWQLSPTTETVFCKGSFSLVDFSIARQCHSWPRMTKETFVPQDPNAIIFSVGSDRGEDINQAHCGGSESCIIVLSQRDVSDALRNICSKSSFLCYQTCMYIFICIRTSKCLSKCELLSVQHCWQLAIDKVRLDLSWSASS